MTRLLPLLSAMMLAGSTASAAPLNAVMAEVHAGPGLAYERRLAPRVALRIGLDGVPFAFFGERVNIWSVPVTATWVRGDRSHHLELGGELLGSMSIDPSHGVQAGAVGLSGLVGWRWEPSAPVLVRAGLTAGVAVGRGNTGLQAIPLPLPSLAVGYRF